MIPKLANMIYARLLVHPGLTAGEIQSSFSDENHKEIGVPITLARVVGHLTLMKGEQIVRSRRVPDTSKPKIRLFLHGEWHTNHPLKTIYHLNPLWKPKQSEEPEAL
jgi:hypothetical protein